MASASFALLLLQFKCWIYGIRVNIATLDAVQRICEQSVISIVVRSQYYSEVTTPLMCEKSIARAYAHLERYRRMQSIWYCCWYSMINYYDLWYQFLGGLKQPTHCNSCMMYSTNNISGWCVRSTTTTHTSTTVVTITHQPLQLIKTI